MPRPPAYHVIWEPDEKRWIIREEGSKRSFGAFNNKLKAVNEAGKLAESKNRAQMVIHRRDGSIHKEVNYGRIPYRFKK